MVDWLLAHAVRVEYAENGWFNPFSQSVSGYLSPYISCSVFCSFILWQNVQMQFCQGNHDKHLFARMLSSVITFYFRLLSVIAFSQTKLNCKKLIWVCHLMGVKTIIHVGKLSDIRMTKWWLIGHLIEVASLQRFYCSSLLALISG